MKVTAAARRALTILNAHPTARVAAHRPHPDVHDGLDIAAQTARRLVENGWATMSCDITGDGLVLTATGTYHDPGRLQLLEPGRTALRRPTPETTRTLAPAGRRTGADEHGHLHDGADPLDAGAYVDPDDLSGAWSRAARTRHETVKPTRRRRAA